MSPLMLSPLLARGKDLEAPGMPTCKLGLAGGLRRQWSGDSQGTTLPVGIPPLKGGAARKTAFLYPGNSRVTSSHMSFEALEPGAPRMGATYREGMRWADRTAGGRGCRDGKKDGVIPEGRLKSGKKGIRRGSRY